jgi:glycosyltransferase involved in cell wall biosynthesis
MLLVAYNILLKRNPYLEFDLVFTGTLPLYEDELRAAVEALGLKQRVHFLGYLSDNNFSAVFQGCRFLIFPSLYEGFGVPLLEAFLLGKPVLCSNVGSLPEIGGKAACYFDPRKPLEIVKSIEQLINNPSKVTELINCGFEQVKKFNKENMGRRYMEIFSTTIDRASFHDRH